LIAIAVVCKSQSNPALAFSSRKMEPTPLKTGDRAVVVIDRGWIYAGDLTIHEDCIILSRTVHVFSWNRIGFNGMIANPKSSDVDLRPMEQLIEVPKKSIIYSVPVDKDWGL
jgi:hypothetical protein